MKTWLQIVIAILLLYLSIIETVQVVTMMKAIEFAQQELAESN